MIPSRSVLKLVCLYLLLRLVEERRPLDSDAPLAFYSTSEVHPTEIVCYHTPFFNSPTIQVT